jgi:PAS domain S-box-containing protein
MQRHFEVQMGLTTDSQELKRLQEEIEALRRERDQLRDALVGIPDGILLRNAADQLAFANPAAAELLGFSCVEELMHAPDAEILDRFEILNATRDLRSADEFPTRLALRGEPRPDAVLSYRVRATGEQRWANIQARPIVDDEGSIKHVVTVLRDVTEPKRTESTLRFMSEMTSLLSTSLDYEETLTRVAELLVPRLADWSAVQLVEENGGVTHLVVAHSDPAKVAWARQLQERYPFDPDAATGVAQVLRTGETLFYPEIPAELIEQADLDDERLQILEELAPRSIIIAPLSARGRILGAITLCMAESSRTYTVDDLEFVKDLAWRSAIAVDNARLYHEAREVSRRAERQSEQLLGLTRASLLINDEQSLSDVMQAIAEQARIVTTSHMALISLTTADSWAQTITAKSLSERYERWRDFDAPIDGSGIYHLVCSTNQPIRLTQDELAAHPAFRGYGSYAQLHPPLRGWLAVPLVGRDGRNVGLVQVSDRDEGDYSLEDENALTQLARMASIAIENVRLYEEAQAAIQSRDQFLSMAAHELKTPMTTIKGFVQLLIRRMRRPEFDPGYFEESADNLEEQIIRLESLLNDLLDTSRMHHQGANIKPAPVELRSLAEQVMARFEHTSERNERHRLVLDAPQPVSGIWDAERLDQVLTNLISNALKYSPDGGEVRVAMTSCDEQVTIRVSDQGIGMSAEDLARVFEPFARSEAARRTAGGTGLGLFIARQMIEQHGGSIAIESEVGTGTTFTVTLPANAEKPVA